MKNRNTEKSEKDIINKKTVIFCAVAVICVLLVVGFTVSNGMKKKNGDNVSEVYESEAESTLKKVSAETTVPVISTSASAVSETATAERNADVTANMTSSAVKTTQSVAKTTVPVTKSGGVKLLSKPTLIRLPESDSEWELILLNTYYRVPSDTDNILNLKPAIRGSDVYLDYRAAAAYQKMYDAGRKDGVTLTPCSGYRSYALQKDLYDELVDEYLYDGYSQGESEALASTRRMPAGSSEHNIGIAMDICYVDSSFRYSAEYKWLCENAENYGFILRYTEDNRQYTGVKSEPWHWRYVGVENAKKINASGLSLEQYLGKVN